MSGDLVRGRNRADATWLPRMPAARLGLQVDYVSGPWFFGAGVVHTADQTRTAPGEEPSDDYTLVNLWAGRTFRWGGTVLDAFVRGSNLTDAEARPHTSYLREIAPLPGRDITFGLRVSF